MLIALMVASGFVALLIGGKTLLTGLIMLPIVGPAIGWYAELARPHLAPGVIEQLICGGMAVQVVVVLLAVPVYLPGMIRRGIAAYCARTAAQP